MSSDKDKPEPPSTLLGNDVFVFKQAENTDDSPADEAINNDGGHANLFLDTTLRFVELPTGGVRVFTGMQSVKPIRPDEQKIIPFVRPDAKGEPPKDPQ